MSKCYWPITGAGHQQTEEVVDDECEDDSSDGAARDGITGIFQVPWKKEKKSLGFNGLLYIQTITSKMKKKILLPDMLEPAMIPVQPLNITANTVAKVIMVPVV